MNKINYCIVDFETSSVDPHTCYPLQLSAIVLDGQTLDEIEDATFNQFMKPIVDIDINDPNIKDDALRVCGIKREDIPGFPLERQAWENFVNFCMAYIEGKSEFDRLIPVYYNGINFDQIIIDRLVEKYKTKKPFNKRIKVDMMDELFLWVEDLHGRKNIESLSFDNIRNQFNLGNKNEKFGAAHSGLRDVHDLKLIFQRFLKWRRMLSKKTDFTKGWN